MTDINERRGHESQNHLDQKREVANLLLSWGYDFVVFENKFCDVAAKKCGGENPHILCIEVERTIRNFLRNITRNFANGAHFVLVVCPNRQSINPYRMKLIRSLDMNIQKRILISPLETLSAKELEDFTSNSQFKSESTPI